MEIFARAGWLSFFEKFWGSDTQVILYFPQNFNGSRDLVQQLMIMVIEEFVSKVIGLLQQGEMWYINFKIPNES